MVRGDAQSTCRDQSSAASASWSSRGASTGVRSPSNSRGFVAGLASVETEEELEFVSDEIRRRVIASGQEFAHEQWWTAGRSLSVGLSVSLTDGGGLLDGLLPDVGSGTSMNIQRVSKRINSTIDCVFVELFC